MDDNEFTTTQEVFTQTEKLKKDKIVEINTNYNSRTNINDNYYSVDTYNTNENREADYTTQYSNSNYIYNNNYSNKYDSGYYNSNIINENKRRNEIIELEKYEKQERELYENEDYKKMKLLVYKINGKLDAIKNNIKKKKEQRDTGMCTIVEYERYIIQQKQNYIEIEQSSDSKLAKLLLQKLQLQRPII